MAGRNEILCQVYQEPLKLFCKDDEALVCMVCVKSGEHKDHRILFLEEVSPEYKEKFAIFLDMLKKERDRIVKQVTGEKRQMVTNFRELHSLLEKQENRLVAQLEEVEEEVGRNRDQHLIKFSEALSSVDSLIQEVKEKCQQPPTELLQGARSLLQRCEGKPKFRNPVRFSLALKWKIWETSNPNPNFGG
uniref:Uncharacterized protein n=1 Tax=Sphaerodactylus townsendi TaxID=933632 RepID=A0ACB8EFT7_9SAUR